MHESFLPAPLTKSKPWGVWATVGLSLIIVGAFFLIQLLVLERILAFRINQQTGAPPDVLTGNLAVNGFALAIATLVSSPICVALIVAFVKWRKQLSLREYLGLRRPTQRQFTEWCLITVLCSVAIDLLKLFLDLPIVPSFVTTVYKTAYVLPLFYFTVVVAAPLFEELFFRGFIYQGIKYSFLGIRGAIVLPALLWAAIHNQYNWLDMGWIFAFGIVLGFARWRTRSTYVAIAMHALHNLISLLQIAWDGYLS